MGSGVGVAAGTGVAVGAAAVVAVGCGAAVAGADDTVGCGATVGATAAVGTTAAGVLTAGAAVAVSVGLDDVPVGTPPPHAAKVNNAPITIIGTANGPASLSLIDLSSLTLPI
ncbi:MAG: hypothetical protein IID01_08160 [Chloroflexi bacterium]|nr:hypothetical protein [Chloroflexota bacterium]